MTTLVIWILEDPSRGFSMSLSDKLISDTRLTPKLHLAAERMIKYRYPE